MSTAALLHAHVDAAEGKPVEWGSSDCTSWCAAWVKAVTGKTVPFLGSYSSLNEAHALIDAAGGLDVLWTQALARAGIYQTPYPPQLGDIGIVDTRRFGPVGAIFAADGIALCRDDRGTGLLRPRAPSIIKVWSI